MSTLKVASFIADTDFEEFPPAVVAQAKVAIRDTLGVALAAHGDRAVEATRGVALAMGGTGESTLIGIGAKAPCNIAAWVNAVMASTLDMDDGAWGTTGHKGHTGGIVVPSALAVAEAHHATGREFITAVVVGYEVALRTGWMIAKTIDHPLAAGTPGTYGATATVATLRGLRTEEIVNALGIAEAHCPWYHGEGFHPVNMTKEVAGWGAMTGVSAVLLAREGFGGRRAIYDHPTYDRTPLETLGKEWEILDLYFKPYSACRFCHPSLDGVLQLAKEYHLKTGDISKITVGVPSVRLAENFAKYRPPTIWEAQYSIPFTIGAALVDGEVGPEQVAEQRLADGTILGLANTVTLVADPDVEALLPEALGGKVRIETKDGSEYETFVTTPKGDPANPLTEEELSGKFRKLAGLVLGAERTEELFHCLQRLEELESLDELVKIIGRCR
ncbi:MAG: MmgE/PrpD family protein [Deltaproteobacteria bacterium]|nr:MAG: MmgE/PrpD family protein [Deltaproteobacteria bacterium]